MIEGFLGANARLRGVVLLLDARHTPTDDDLHMLEFFATRGTPALVAATKVDKLRPSERDARLAALVREAGIETDQLIPFSAVTGEGRDELAEAVVALVTTP